MSDQVVAIMATTKQALDARRALAGQPIST